MSERELFVEALRITDPAERAAYLVQACAGDAGLQQRVERLLEAHFEMADSVEGLSSPDASTDQDSSPPTTDGTKLPSPGDPPSTGPNSEEHGNSKAQGVETKHLGSEPPSDFDGTFDWSGPSHTAQFAVAGLSQFDLLAELGRGGMGVVYKARHRQLNRIVALKMIGDGKHASPDHRERFLIEAEAVARLHHPNIVQIYDIGEADGHPFVTLEVLEGGTLAHRLKGTTQAGGAAAELVATLALAMHAAHQAGIIHRDLKPSNVLFDGEGVPKIVDFGLAKRLEVEEGHTYIGQVMGTPSYMAPEQARGLTRLIGPPADIYSLGAILPGFTPSTAPVPGSSSATAVAPAMLVPLSETSLALVGTLLVTVLTPGPSTTLGTVNGIQAEVNTSFLSVGPSQGQGFLTRLITAESGEEEGVEGGPETETEIPVKQGAGTTAPPWSRYVLGLDEVFEQFRQENQDALHGKDEEKPAVDDASPEQDREEPSGTLSPLTPVSQAAEPLPSVGQDDGIGAEAVDAVVDFIGSVPRVPLRCFSSLCAEIFETEARVESLPDAPAARERGGPVALGMLMVTTTAVIVRANPPGGPGGKPGGRTGTTKDRREPAAPKRPGAVVLKSDRLIPTSRAAG